MASFANCNLIYFFSTAFVRTIFSFIFSKRAKMKSVIDWWWEKEKQNVWWLVRVLQEGWITNSIFLDDPCPKKIFVNGEKLIPYWYWFGLNVNIYKEFHNWRGVILDCDLGEKVSLSWLTSPYLELREKWKCLDCIGKSKIWTKTSLKSWIFRKTSPSLKALGWPLVKTIL